jgi:hypothetical protein
MVSTSKSLALVQGVHPLDNVSTEQIGEILPKRELDAAFREEKKLQKDKSMMLSLFLSIGQSLKKIRDNRWYKALGYDTFEDWSESPDIDIDRSSSYRYIKLFEVFVDSGAFELSEVEDKSISKLEILIPYVHPKHKDWNDRKVELLELLSLSRKDLTKALNERGDSRYAVAPSSNRNAAGSMAVGASYQVSDDTPQKPSTSKSSKEADRTFDEVVKPKSAGESVSATEATKKLGLSGWYEMVPTAEPPSGKGKVSKGVYITTESVIVTGNRIFVNVE